MSLQVLARVLQWGLWVDWTHHTVYCATCKHGPMRRILPGMEKAAS